jgi:hypothetical protein
MCLSDLFGGLIVPAGCFATFTMNAAVATSNPRGLESGLPAVVSEGASSAGGEFLKCGSSVPMSE